MAARHLRLLVCRLLAVVGVAALPARSANAVELPARLTLADAVTMFRQRGFDLIVARIAVDSARADERAAGALANPIVAGSINKTFGYDASCHGCSDMGWGVSVSDQGALSNLLAGKRGLRLDVARAATGATKYSRDDTERLLEFAVKQQYLNAALAQANVELTRTASTFAARTFDLVSLRYRTGAVSEADVARSETAKLESEQAVDAALQTLATAKVALAFLLGVGRPSFAFELDPTVLFRRPPRALDTFSDEALLRLAQERRPDVRAAALQKSRAAASVALNRRQRVPDVGLNADFSQQGTGQLAILPPTLTLGVSLPLPALYQYQGEIAKAEADLRTQDVLVSRTRAQVVAEVEIALATYRSTRSRVVRMESGLLDRAARARDLVEVQYEKGAASLLELLDAQRTYLSTNVAYLQTLDDYWTAIYSLEKATSTELAK